MGKKTDKKIRKEMMTKSIKEEKNTSVKIKRQKKITEDV